MGRYYSGDISGKFWFGVQSSTDAENFGGKIHRYQQYACCQCRVVDDSSYCKDCYENYEKHLEDSIDDEYSDVIIEGQFFDMVFKDDQLKEVQQHIIELNKSVLKFIKSFKIDAKSEYEYDFEINDIYKCKSNPFGSFNDLVSKHDMELIARWCLARQVRQCLIDKGECVFNCEP